MTNRTIKHEIKLQKSVIVILGILAVGVFANAFAPAFSVKKADAAFGGGGDGMIAADAAAAKGVWQLKSGKVRMCAVESADNGQKTFCSLWSN